ncbi:Serine-protein kinase rsbW [Urinicoccus massiliensis]|uniref:Serine-protein kinase rsbW n=1 Tax=Urinicoccus massiliensis TaxID=1723382 RepID=A0A8H2M9Y4_9FIRM|nr:hypothetical protein [Urinicoccus massiliensis]VFB17391.1 Serine-protein kinase rsbW [Urinicoccus massiliensis]
MNDFLSLSFPRKKDYIPVARLTTSYLASLKNLDLDTIEDLRMIVTEACNLSYFLQEDQGDISLKISLGKEEITFAISCPYPEKIKEDDGSLMSESIIRSLADDLDYRDSTMLIFKSIYTDQ